MNEIEIWTIVAFNCLNINVNCCIVFSWKRVSLQFSITGGSSTELPSQKGAAHFLASAAYSGNQKNTGVRLVRFFESLGVAFSARADREKVINNHFYASFFINIGWKC